MDSNFPPSLKRVLQSEGGWSDNPKDPGGATMKGVTIATYQRYINKNGTKADLRKITDEQLRTVYKRQYWDAAGCDHLPVGLDFAVFDFAVNSGPGKAKQYLAKVPGGAGTIDAYCDARLAYMKRIKDRQGRSLWKTFGKGWQRRVDAVRSEAKTMANNQPVSLVAIEPKPAPVPAPAPDKAIIEAAQLKLTDLKYNPGGADGVIGPLTAGAIRIFRADNGLPEGDGIDNDFLLALSKAAPRKMVPERANATATQVAAVVPEAKAHSWNKIVALGGGAATAAGGALDYIAPAISYLQPVRDFFFDIPTPVWITAVVVVLGVVWWNARAGQKASDEAYRTGERR